MHFLCSSPPQRNDFYEKSTPGNKKYRNVGQRRLLKESCSKARSSNGWNLQNRSTFEAMRNVDSKKGISIKSKQVFKMQKVLYEIKSDKQVEQRKVDSRA